MRKFSHSAPPPPLYQLKFLYLIQSTFLTPIGKRQRVCLCTSKQNIFPKCPIFSSASSTRTSTRKLFLKCHKARSGSLTFANLKKLYCEGRRGFKTLFQDLTLNTITDCKYLPPFLLLQKQLSLQYSPCAVGCELHTLRKEEEKNGIRDACSTADIFIHFH